MTLHRRTAAVLVLAAGCVGGIGAVPPPDGGALPDGGAAGWDVDPPPGADASASLGPAPGAQQRLAAAGVLSPEQLARLRRLAGRG